MSESTEQNTESVSVEDVLQAQALAEMAKSGNRVKTTVLLASIVKFVNSGDTTLQHFEQAYPTITVARLRSIIKQNPALKDRVWPIKSDDFGIVLVNVTQ